MTRKYTLIYSLLCFCGSLLSFVSSARAQNGCTPVVYVFRHAEDEKEGGTTPCLEDPMQVCSTALTALGMKHACLYRDEMMPNFEAAHADYCRVEYVLAIDPIKPGGVLGTTNPYRTGRPLSLAVSPLLPNKSPIVTIGGKNIDEKLTNVTPQDLRTYLHSILNTNTGASAAIFWTSDGLRDLGKALSGEAGNVIPEKDKALGVPPRNAAYVFISQAGQDLFAPPTRATQYIQCYDYKVKNNTIKWYDSGDVRYYCGKPQAFGSLDPNIVPMEGEDPCEDAPKFPQLHARICARDNLISTSTPNYYGYCQ